MRNARSRLMSPNPEVARRMTLRPCLDREDDALLTPTLIPLRVASSQHAHNPRQGNTWVRALDLHVHPPSNEALKRTY